MLTHDGIKKMTEKSGARNARKIHAFAFQSICGIELPLLMEVRVYEENAN